jgi:hypothetical protein
MNENEQDFGTLRQFLKLKRHETPPPGYFNHFSGEVIARIRENNSGEERIFSEAPWLLKFLQLFEFKPAFAGAFASALFLLLAFGFVFADRPETAPQPLLQNAGQPSSSFASATPVALSQSTESSGIIASTNPATSLQPVASLFNSQNPFAQQVSLTVPGN